MTNFSIFYFLCIIQKRWTRDISNYRNIFKKKWLVFYPKIGKNMNFLRKIVIFHTKYLKNFRASLRNWKKYDFLAYNRDFSHEILQKFSRLPPLGAIFLSAPPPPNLKSWIRPRVEHVTFLITEISLKKNDSFLIVTKRYEIEINRKHIS